MVDYSSYVAMRPLNSALCSKDKGDITNRLQCAGEHVVNNVRSTGAGLLTLGASASAGCILYNCPKAVKFLAKVFDKVGKSAYNFLVGNTDKTKGIAKITTKVAKQFQKLPSSMKAVSFIAIPTVLALGYITNKFFYNSGQIDQKYTDRAVMEERLKRIMA